MTLDFNTLISFIALIISFVALYTSLRSKFEENAPLLLSAEAELCFNYINKKLTLPDKFPSNGQQFILDFRSFCTPENEYTEAIPSLILDSRIYSTSERRPPMYSWIAFTKLKLYNAGFDLISFEITSIEIFFNSQKAPYTLNANPHNKFYIYLKSGESMPLYLTYIFDDEYALLNPTLIKSSEQIKACIEQLSTIKSNIYNTYVPLIMDNYEKMVYYITTVNKYGIKYTQTLTFSVKSDMYFVENSIPKLDRNKNINRVGGK